MDFSFLNESAAQAHKEQRTMAEMTENKEVWSGRLDGRSYSLHYVNDDLFLLETFGDGSTDARKIENTPEANHKVVCLMLSAGATPEKIVEAINWDPFAPTKVVWEGVCDDDEKSRWQVVVVSGRLFKMRLEPHRDAWPADRGEIVCLLLRSGLTAAEIAEVLPASLTHTTATIIHPRDIAKERLAELGTHLVNDSLSGVLELLLRSLTPTAEALLPALLRHLEKDEGADGAKAQPVQVAPLWPTSVADSFDSGWHAGQIDACRQAAESVGWTFPYDILDLMQTGRLLPVQVLSLLGKRIAEGGISAADAEAFFSNLRKAAV
jgi:hypothetical protein